VSGNTAVHPSFRLSRDGIARLSPFERREGGAAVGPGRASTPGSATGAVAFPVRGVANATPSKYTAPLRALRAAERNSPTPRPAGGARKISGRRQLAGPAIVGRGLWAARRAHLEGDRGRDRDELLTPQLRNY